MVITAEVALGQNLMIQSLDANGQLVWNDAFSNGYYDLAWATALQGSNWNWGAAGLANLPAAGGGLMRVQVPLFSQPMFFRLAHTQTTNNSICGTVPALPPGGLPPYTDYCAMLEHNINGIETGFLAGNGLFYVGGIEGDQYNIIEHETLGFTHPFWNDGRCRGQGVATNVLSGVGSDYQGTDFYRNTHCLYGSVKLGSTWYTYPTPIQMLWRPDRQTTTYSISGVTIQESKFITQSNVLCDIITSTSPVSFAFDGHSYVHSGWTQQINSTVAYDPTNNAIHLVEHGTILCEPVNNGAYVVGRLMYDGMSVFISANQNFSGAYTLSTNSDGSRAYSFTLPCNPGSPLVLVYSMGDDYAATAASALEVETNAQAELQAKTDYMNSLLNYQIPFFRCSDQKVVQQYYYLWSLYFMYMLDVHTGFDTLPHTQSAVNNYLGPWCFDMWGYTRLSSWVADKPAYGYGNILVWSNMLAHSQAVLLPETFGTTWWSPVFVDPSFDVENAWKTYLHTGDLVFLNEAYAFYSQLYSGVGSNPDPEWGIGINVLDSLANMATALGKSNEASGWMALTPALLNSFNAGWQQQLADYYGPTNPMDIWNITSLLSDAMPNDWASAMDSNWVMNTEEGYLGQVPIQIRANITEPAGVFNASSLTTYLVNEGMYRHHLDADAIHCTLAHLAAMTNSAGDSTAPEAWQPNLTLFGDQYLNWDTAMVLPLIEHLAGVDYSIPGNTLTVCDDLPPTWSFLDLRIPIVSATSSNWTRVLLTRLQNGNQVSKIVLVQDNPLTNLVIQPWLENREFVTATAPIQMEAPSGHVGFVFQNSSNQSIEVTLGTKLPGIANYRVLVLPSITNRTFTTSITVSLLPLMCGTQVRYTLDGSTPTTNSALYMTPFTLTTTTSVKACAFKPGESEPGPLVTALFTRTP